MGNKVGRLVPWGLQAATAVLQALAEARGILFPWVAVFLAFGIGLWFSLGWEPGLLVYAGAAAVALLMAGFWRWGPEHGHPFAVAAGCIALGFLAAGARAHLVAAPVLEFRYYGPVQGRIIEIDRSQSDFLRLTLDQVVLDRVAPARTPQKVRVSLHGAQGFFAPDPGQVVMLTGMLGPPEGPVEPGGFDFQRMAWFDRLGAIGYTASPVLLLERPADGEQRINRWRTRLSNAIMAEVPGDAGAFSSGVMTGDRSGLSLEAVVDLRKSSLAHLLAISGMNMAFLTAFVFALVRYGLALLPVLALRLNSKKLAAVVALGVAWVYLQLSGANVATERAFVTVVVMLGAVLFDRRALSLRSVAISAVVLLLLQPESLLEPGFQMSFAATTALVAGFGALEGGVLHGRVPRWFLPVFTLVLSSLLAGLATAPYGAATFNRIADYGFFANLLTVPVMGAVVMPAGAIAALLAPIGLQDLPLWVMGRGSAWILWVSFWIAGMEGSVTAVPVPGPWVIPLITLGGLWLILWRGWLRGAGLVPMALALVLWAGVQRPDALISADGGLVGLMGPEGRAVSSPRGAGFAAKSWLEDDGDLAEQVDAAERAGFSGDKGARSFVLGPWRAVVLKGKAAAGAVPAACAGADLVVVAAEVAAPEGCEVIDQTLLSASGGLALWLTDEGSITLQPAFSAKRLWSPQGGQVAARSLPPPGQ
ncbi:ComEC/Rec2 family competence protein [Rhodobacter ferrooxidans]|uniref:ComEC/Rec2-related protein n=1 Tax=Rhodobacter ferrooxidans TaxID=371731 RepID=C8S2M1_9RHOB|nr:ComEC/Rec2 family competence protein [Rhodobacter sp. SW2]EEW24697.1 ComEC/Rec2-related protein [Rhodobacter sp. SW2]